MPRHQFSGVVVSGNRRGRLLGFPTANLSSINAHALPPDGVYAGFVRLPGRSDWLGATISMGWNQTFDDVMEHRVEAHIHDFNDQIYGLTIEVAICSRLRSMQRFGDAGELTWQIARDVQQSRSLLAALTPADLLADGPPAGDVETSTFPFSGDNPS